MDKNYVLLKSSYSREQNDKLLFDKYDKVLEEAGYDQKDRNEANNIAYVDGLDVYLFFDGLNIGVNKDVSEILWSRKDDSRKQKVAITKNPKKLDAEDAPATIKVLADNDPIERLYNFNVDINQLDPEDEEQAEYIMLMEKDQAKYIDEYTAFIKRDKGYTSIYFRTVHYTGGDTADFTDIVELTEEQYQKIMYLLKK